MTDIEEKPMDAVHRLLSTWGLPEDLHERWLSEPCSAFGGSAPNDLIALGRCQEIIDALTAIQVGDTRGG